MALREGGLQGMVNKCAPFVAWAAPLHWAESGNLGFAGLGGPKGIGTSRTSERGSVIVVGVGTQTPWVRSLALRLELCDRTWAIYVCV